MCRNPAGKVGGCVLPCVSFKLVCRGQLDRSVTLCAGLTSDSPLGASLEVEHGVVGRETRPITLGKRVGALRVF